MSGVRHSGSSRASSPTDTPHGFCQCGCGEKTTIARKNDRSRAMVKGEPMRFLSNHHARVTNRPWRALKESDYLVAETGYGTPCWLWMGSRRGNGYGKVGIGGRYVAAHRAFFERDRGAIPDGMELDHLCKVRLCVNPEHLEVVTHKENVRRGNNTRLTDETIAQIRDAEGSSVDIARRFGISQSHAWDIRAGRIRV